MKQIPIGQLDPTRLLTYLLSRLVDAHPVEDKQLRPDRRRRRATAALARCNRWGNAESRGTTLAIALLLNCNKHLGERGSVLRNMIFMEFLYVRMPFPLEFLCSQAQIVSVNRRDAFYLF